MRCTMFAAVMFGLMTGAAFAQTAAPLDHGKRVYATAKCSVCHSIEGAGNKKGPLDAVGARLTAAEIDEWIVSAPAMAAKAKAVRKPVMKAYPNIVKDDRDALVAYLSSLKKP